MSTNDFVRYAKVLQRLTADFVRAVPDDRWSFTPDPPGRSGRAPAPIGLETASHRSENNCGMSSASGASIMPR